MFVITFAIQLGLFIVGVFAIIQGRFKVGSGREVLGSRARRLGLLCLLPVPTAILLAMILGIFLGAQGVAVGPQHYWPFFWVEVGPLIVTGFLLTWLGGRYYDQQQGPKRSPAKGDRSGDSEDLREESLADAVGD